MSFVVMMKYLIYKITNNTNGRYYIGRHRTIDIDDGYMGSGIGIKNAINKYGIENFSKEIIAESWDETNLWELEKIIVNEEIVKDPLSYNMSYGGKHYLHGLRTYDPGAFIKHQRTAGQKGGPSCYNKKTQKEKQNWHRKGGSASSKKRSAEYHYKIQTNLGEVYTVNGHEFKSLCLEKGWNHATLQWNRSWGKQIAKGPLRGFRVDQISNPSTE
jgi:hypothetical protein